jgi:hypothetical protein
MPPSARRPGSGPAAEPVSRSPEPRTWQGIVYRPCQAGAGEVRRLLDFVGAWTPPPTPGELAWEARAEARLIGGVVVEVDGAVGFVHGPVVIEPPGGADALEVAAQLVAPLLEEAGPRGLTTFFTRPQGLDRLWVRFGFVPVPEASVPAALRGRPGTGLHMWRRPGTYAIAAPDADAGRRRPR